jgi:hypothetical protein
MLAASEPHHQRAFSRENCDGEKVNVVATVKPRSRKREAEGCRIHPLAHEDCASAQEEIVAETSHSCHRRVRIKLRFFCFVALASDTETITEPSARTAATVVMISRLISNLF